MFKRPAETQVSTESRKYQDSFQEAASGFLRAISIQNSIFCFQFIAVILDDNKEIVHIPLNDTITVYLSVYDFGFQFQHQVGLISESHQFYERKN
ncbi:hypothetical protein NPIL_183791 [Nephila pilipes]|uniref:Uncharacterized protein n=1 Tax=Nephila pilipes TaxID=299642 RepID=A0A8X6N6L2_NEPPI|nr:hypothetical protein NPIL_183791 [Nephila pilipes]